MNTINKVIRFALITIAALSWTAAAATHIIEGIAYADQARQIEWVCDTAQKQLSTVKGHNAITNFKQVGGTFGPTTTCSLTADQTGERVQFQVTLNAQRGLVIREV